MGKEWSKAQTKSRGWWWKAPLIIISLLSLTLLIIILNINAIALSQINSTLEKTLSSGGHLANFDLQLSEGQLELSALTLNPPEGFDTAAPLSMNNVKLSVALGSLFDQPIIINEFTLDALAITLVRDKQGELNVLHLLPPPDPSSADTEETANTEIDTETKEPLSIPAIQVKRIAINNLTLTVIDHLIGEQWTAKVALDLNVDNIQLNDLMDRDIAIEALSIAISKLNIDQIPGYSEAPLLTLDNVSLTANNLNLSSPNIPLHSLLLEGLAISVEQDSNRELNIQQLISSWQPQDHHTAEANNTPITEATPSIKETKPSEEEAKPANTTVPSISIGNIKLNSISAQLLSHVTPQLWRTGFDQLDIQLTDLGIAQNNITLGNAGLTLKGIEVDQAPGFGDEKLLSLEQLAISTDTLDTAAEELTVNKIALHTLSSSIHTNAEGLSNIQALSDTLSGKTELATAANAEQPATKPQAESSSSTPQKPLPIINIEHILMDNSSLTYSDAAIASKLLTFPLRNIEFDTRQLRLFDNNPEAAPASIGLAFELEQPNALPNAHLGAIAVMGPINTGIPAINSQVRIGGFKLDTIDPLIPPSSRTALGADGFDAAIAIALNHQAINLTASVLSDQNIAYNAIAVKGPISAPTIEIGAILAGVYSRFSDGLINLGKGGLNAGLDIASSGVGIAEAVGSGTISIGKNLGVSLFEAGTGLVTLDQQQLSHGLVGTSKGTLDIGYNSVAKSGNAATGGLKGSYQNLDGSNALQAWNDGIEARYENSMLQAESALLQMAYPPAIK